MATGDRGAPAAGGARQADAPERLRALTVAGDRSASDRSPVARGASEEEEGAGRAIQAEKDDAPELEEEQEEAKGGQEEGRETRDATATEEVDWDGVDDDENTSTHLPFAAVEEELLDETSTVDPSYTISLVTQLRPKGSSVDKEFGFLAAILLSSADVSWAQTLLPVHTLSIVWNTENLTLLGKLLDCTTTVDPSYTISLIRQLIPKGSSVEKEFSDKQSEHSDDGYSPQPDNADPSSKSDKRDFPEEMSVCPDDEGSTRHDYKNQSEEDQCIRDLAASKPQTFPSVRRTCIVRMFVIFITLMWMIGLASAGGTSSCQVSSLATNIREYCGSDFPSALCCDALQAAATRGGGQNKCLCLVGEAPDIVSIGFSAENLIRLYNRCTHRQEEFVCDEDNVDTFHMKRDKTTIEEFVDQGDEREEAPYPRNQPHKFESKDPKHRGQGDEREEAPYPRNRHHKFESEDPEYQGQGDEREEAPYPRDRHHKFESKEPKHMRQGDSTFDLEDEASKEHQPHFHSYSVVITAVSTVLLIILLVSSFVEHYRRHGQVNWRQLLNLAVAVGLGPNPANGGLPIQVPAIQAPPVVNGVPGPEIQAPPLAMFPRPAEALTLLAYILFDRVRHALTNSMF